MAPSRRVLGVGSGRHAVSVRPVTLQPHRDPAQRTHDELARARLLWPQLVGVLAGWGLAIVGTAAIR